MQTYYYPALHFIANSNYTIAIKYNNNNISSLANGYY